MRSCPSLSRNATLGGRVKPGHDGGRGCGSTERQGVVRRLSAGPVSSTKTMRVSLNIIPKGYLRAIGITLSFINPALATATSD